MRLLNVHTLRIEEFQGDPPMYTILSHTWGKEEVSFQQLESGSGPGREGYQKLQRCCSKTADEGYDYTWIDTCCIDKTSSAELSEAINSMYEWYSKAEVCYAFLSDVTHLDGGSITTEQDSSFSGSRWFRRGWTLQELLAPDHVVFLDKHWVEIGTKRALAGAISRITNIDVAAMEVPMCKLRSRHLCAGFSIAQRMSWAARRETTRSEDRAYCMMGLFGVNMPLLYGEGGQNAFKRLLSEIMKNSNDDSVFAWQNGWSQGTLATTPGEYDGCSMICSPERRRAVGGAGHDSIVSRYEVNKSDITITAPLIKVDESSPPVYEFCGGEDMAEIRHKSGPTERQFVAVLDCSISGGRLGIILTKSSTATGSLYCRANAEPLVVLKWEHCLALGPPMQLHLCELPPQLFGRPCSLPTAISSKANTMMTLVLSRFPAKLDDYTLYDWDGTKIVYKFVPGYRVTKFETGLVLMWLGEPRGALWGGRGVRLKLDFRRYEAEGEVSPIPAVSIVCCWTAGSWKFDIQCWVEKSNDESELLQLENVSPCSRYSKFLLGGGGGGGGHIFAETRSEYGSTLECRLRYQKVGG